ncbi:hypothetical protein BDV97DRAFT_425639 [Delphinella strobiligena]|nr:hypothetical protein BDV97DRAFT_425639 [Delphinella strobiligena]
MASYEHRGKSKRDSKKKWVWEKLDSRMMKELARPTFGPRIIIELAIIADKMPHGPLYPMAHQVEVRFKADPDSVSRLFELARKFRSLQPIEIRNVLVARREEQLINGEWKIRRIDESEADGAEWRIKDTKLPLPERINTAWQEDVWWIMTREMFPLLETENGIPTEAALTLADRYLPMNGPTWFWNTQIPTSPEVVKMYEDIARDPAAKIPHALPYLQRMFHRRTSDMLHTTTIFLKFYNNLRHASNFCMCCPVEDR